MENQRWKKIYNIFLFKKIEITNTLNILKILNKLNTDNIKMDSTNLMQELIDDAQNFTGIVKYCSWKCICSNTILERHKYLDLISKYKGKILDGPEFKRIIEEYNLKRMITVDKQQYTCGEYLITYIDSQFLYSNHTVDEPTKLYTEEDIFSYDMLQSFPYINYMEQSENYICNVKLSLYSKIDIELYIVKLTNERKITGYKSINMIFNKGIHDYMYINNTIVDCCMCLKNSYMEHRRYNRQKVMNGKCFKNKNLKYISFENLNIIDITEPMKEKYKNVTKFIEISDFKTILLYAREKHISMVDFLNDYIYDVEISDEAQIIGSTPLFMCDNATIKLTNKRKLIDDLLLLSYLYYYLFEYHSCIDEKQVNDIFFRNILEYFIEDTLSVKINKMIDLFFNSRAYLLEMNKIKHGPNRTYVNIDVYILSLFNTVNELIKEECNKQCIEFIKSLLDTIMNRKHILIEKFADDELKNLSDKIIDCITKNKCVEPEIIDSLNVQYRKSNMIENL